MEDEVVFIVKTKDGRLRRTEDISEADYVRIPADQYVSPSTVTELAEMCVALKEQLKELGQNPAVAGIDDTSVRITKEEYNGYQKMLRILRDRALQEVERSKADRHGYTLRYADYRSYDRTHPEQKAYLITKTTPISLKIELQLAYFMLIKDLREYYNYIGDPILIPHPDGKQIKISIPTLLTAISQRDDPLYTREFYVSNSESGVALKAYLDHIPQLISFGAIKITANIGLGVYEVTYWTSAPI